MDSFAAYVCSIKCDNLFVCMAFRLYAYGASDKSMACSCVHSYAIGYSDALHSDPFSQRREMSAKILARGLYFPVLL